MVSSTGGPAFTIIRIRRGRSNCATSSWGDRAGVKAPSAPNCFMKSSTRDVVRL